MIDTHEFLLGAIERSGEQGAVDTFYRLAAKVLVADQMRFSNIWLADEMESMGYRQNVHSVPRQIEVQMVDEPGKEVNVTVEP